jgi:hypothetical protein
VWSTAASPTGEKPIGAFARVDGPKTESAEQLSREGKALVTEVWTQIFDHTL